MSGCIRKSTLYLMLFSLVLCTCSTSLATISFSNNTLTYSSPSDLGTTIDPSGQKEVAVSYGLTKASFQALNPQVVAFNSAPTASQTLRTLVATYKTGGTVTFTFPAAMYNYGSVTTYGRGAFSGSNARHAISTVPSVSDSLNDWLDATITTTGGQGVESLGFCAAFRTDQAVPAGQVLFTLSDATTGTVTLPALGGSGNPQLVFIGYTAPAGKTITRVRASRTSTVGGAWVSIDDLAFKMSSLPTVTLSRNNASIAEAGGVCTLTATLSATSSQTVTVNLGYTGTATQGTDYTAANSITINPGNLTGTTNITATQDTLYEGNETVVVDISSVTNGTESGTQQVSTTITDDDSQPSVTLSRNNATIAEAAGVSTLTATLSNTSTQNVTVNLGYTGTATGGGTDYTAANSIVVNAGSLSNTTNITAVQDSSVEGNETIIVDISSVTNGTESGTQQATVTITDDDSGGSLPAPWQRMDIGAVGATGTASYAAPTFTIEGSGADIWDTADEFCYVYQSLSGDGTIVARVASVENTNAWAKAGVMIRESLTAGSKNAAMVATPGQGVAFQWRTTTDGSSGNTQSPGVTVPHYVKLVRSGSSFTAYGSSDGSVWNQMGNPESISMATNVYVGLCVTSHSDGALCTGTFDNVSVATGGGTDTTAPAAVNNLATSSPTSSSITLTWTAPGDDGSTGTAVSYDIRYRTGGAVNDSNWASATQVTGEPTPAIAGTAQSKVVTGLSASTTYYFAIKTSDEVPNTSAISNSPSGTTTAGGGTKTLLTPRNFKYKGYYRVQTHTGGLSELEWGQGFTHRYVGGQLRFLTMSYFPMPEYVQKLIEFAPPADLGGTVTARTNVWPDIWAGMDSSYVGFTGLWYEQATDRLWTSSGIDYPNDTEAQFTKSIAYRTLNSDGTISGQAGPWGLAGVQQRRIYGGVQPIPSWFQSTYGVGPYCTGWGGYASRITIGPCALGPTFYTFPNPAGYPTGDNGIPSSAVKELMSAASAGGDWYANGFPTSFDRGLRNCDVVNDYDEGRWLSPAPDGVGRQLMGDSNWNTGCWIETPNNKHGFILVPQLSSGRAWYETSTLHCQRMTAEIQVFDPYILGEVALGTRAAWNTHPTFRWQITDDMRPLGFGAGQDGNNPYGGPAGASYDSTTQTLYVYCIWGANADSYILLYDIDLQPAAVKDVAIGETAVTGTLGTTAPNGPANWSNTETKDGIYQTIQEVVLSNTSQLERKWTFNVTAGSSVVFNLKSYKTSNTESDNFVFAYSTNGTNWTNMVTVTRTTDDGTYQTYTMPGGTSGTVYVRVQDTDRTAGRNNLDTIYIDQMFFLSNP